MTAGIVLLSILLYIVAFGIGILVTYWTIRLAVRHAIADSQRPAPWTGPAPERPSNPSGGGVWWEQPPPQNP